MIMKKKELIFQNEQKESLQDIEIIDCNTENLCIMQNHHHVLNYIYHSICTTGDGWWVPSDAYTPPIALSMGKPM